MTVSIILYVMFSLLIVGLAVRGFFKGPINGAVGLLRTALSALIAFGAVRLIAFLLPAGKILAAVSKLIESDAGFLITAVASLSGALIYSALLPFVFGLLFCLFYIILVVPSRALTKVIVTAIEKKKSAKAESVEVVEQPAESDVPAAKPKKRFPFAKVGGALIRTVDALLIAVLVLLPFSGIFYTFTDGFDAILSSAEDADLVIKADLKLFGEKLTDKNGIVNISKTHKLLDEKTSPVSKNLFLKLSYIAPLKSLYAVIGASEGSNIAEGNEISQTLALGSDLVYLAKPLAEYGNDQVDAIGGIGTYISGSYFHSTVAANLVSEVSSGLLEDPDTFENNALSMILTPLLEGLSKSTPETIGANVDTLAVVASEMIESGVLADMDNAENMLENEELLTVMIAEVFKNEHLRVTASDMVNAALAEVITQLDEDADVDKIKVDFDSVDEDEIETEAEILARLVSRAYSASAALDGGTLSDADVAEAVKLLGVSLDDARKSELLSGMTDELIMSVIDSGKLGNSADGLSEIVEKHLDDEGLSYGNLLSSVVELFRIINTCKDDDKTNNVTDITAALDSLTSTLDPVTSAIIKEFIDASPELFGVSDGSDGSDGEVSASTQNSQKLVNVFVDKLSSGEITEDEYEREAKALDYAVTLVTMKDNEGISSVKEVYGTPEGMNEMITMFIDSEITSDAIKSIAYDEDGNLTYDALNVAADFDEDDEESFLIQSEQIYHEKSVSGADMETVRENLITVAAVFGIDIEEHIDSWEDME